MRRVLGAALALAMLAIVVTGSQVRQGAYVAPAAVVRVSWSARPERVETCRRLDDAEYAKLPAHMRRRVVCEGTTARYQLEVRRDGAILVTDTVRGGGLRHDRELYVYREIQVPAGPSRVAVRFVRLDSSATADELLRADTTGGQDLANRSAREDAERERRRAEAIPALLAIDTSVVMAPRSVLLVTYGETARKLILQGDVHPR